ncbi:MAG: tetratricopeptide repeat protein, partial [Gemmatimonadota bacterium]|nr:tetratricopeptide repeat protein [Gemmatimonadota bacterium]
MRRPFESGRGDRPGSGDSSSPPSPRAGEEAAHLEQMAEFSRSAGDLAGALGYFDRILSGMREAGAPPGEVARILVEAARCRSQSGDCTGALELLDRAKASMDPTEGGPERLRILNERAYALTRLGDYDAAEECLDEAASAFLDTKTMTQMAHGQKCRGIIALRRGDWDAAAFSFESALTLFREAGDRPGMADSLNNLGLMEKNRGRWTHARGHLLKSLAVFEEVGDTLRVGWSLNNIGLVEFHLGNWETARAQWERALRTLEGIGNRLEIGTACLNLGNYHRHRRNWEVAEQFYSRAEKIAGQLGDARSVILAREFRGDLAVALEEHERARGIYQGALASARRLAPLGDLVLEVLRRQADLESHCGNGAAAQALLTEAEAVSAGLGENSEAGALRRLAARLAAMDGDIPAAAGSYRESLEIQRRFGSPYELAVTRLEFAAFRVENILDLDQAGADLREAVALFDHMGASYEAGCAYLTLARLETVLTEPTGDARGHLRQAMALLDRVGDEEDRMAVRRLHRDIDRRLEDESLTERNDLAVLNDAVGRVCAAEDSSARVSVMETTLKERLVASSAVLLLRGQDTTEWSPAAGSSKSEKECARIVRQVVALEGNGSFGPRPLVSTNPSVDSRFEKLPPEELEDTGSILFMPLFSEEEFLGGVHVARSREAGDFRQSEIDFVVGFAATAAMAVQEMRLEAVRRENLMLRRRLTGRDGFHGILTQSRRMLEIIELIEKIRSNESTVLLQGETGTGKELLARAIHASSARRDAPFVTINCAAISRSVLESELFGH